MPSSNLAKTLWPAAAALLLCGAAPRAMAQAVSTAPTQSAGISQEQALALSARLDALERRNDELERQIQDLKAQATAGDEALKTQAAAQSKVTISNGRPQIATADGQFTAAFRGVFQLDGAIHDQHAAGPLATDFRRGSFGDAGEADHARDMSDGAVFRRARIGIEGKAFGDWTYGFLYDFGGTGVESAGQINQAWLQYDGLGRVKLKVGAFAPLAGMDDATSAYGTVFLERAAISEVMRGLAAGDGRTAVAVTAGGGRWAVSGALTGNTVGKDSFDDQLGFVGRAAFVPWKSDAGLVHLGVNTSVVIDPAATGPDVGPAGAATPVRLRERPESRVDSVRLVDTGNIDAHRVVAWGLEAAAQLHALTLQSEYSHIGVERRASALSDPDFSGWYVQGSWTLTGEPRRYAMSSGAFDIPRPKKPFNLKTGGWGAWEIAARYSDLDLNDTSGAAPIRGGEQQVWTLGLNWYPNAAVRFQANFQDVDVSRISPGGTAFGAGALTPPAGAQVGQDFRIWSFRTQYAF
jgi:phosphate-selective porin OprO/OprP